MCRVPKGVPAPRQPRQRTYNASRIPPSGGSSSTQRQRRDDSSDTALFTYMVLADSPSVQSSCDTSSYDSGSSCSSD